MKYTLEFDPWGMKPVRNY